MPTIFYNKYTDWTKDLTYSETTRQDISYYTLRDYWLEEFSKIVNMSIEEVKTLIDKII